MGRLGALLRPTWRSYAGPPQWHYKAPLCCERLMKGMLRGVLFCPLLAGEVRRSRIGGGERSEPVSRIVILPYDTKSKSRNVLASPLGEEGHEVAKGCTRVRMIMILDVDVTAERRHYNTHRPLKGKRLTTFCASLRSGGRRLAVRTAMEHPIGALPCTPFASSRRSPQGETRSMESENRESYISCTIPQFPPLVVNAVSQSPACVSCHMTHKANPVTFLRPL